ncbi:hypothetical protein JCM10212_005082 [Sporobolomyces blumeae]
MAPAPRGSASGQTFPCTQCDKSFSRKEYMARHFRSKHSKEKPFSCEYCSHGFSRSDLLRRHYKTCSEAKALGVSGPPPGSEAASSNRPKRKPSPTRASPSSLEPEGFPAAHDEDAMLPDPPPTLPDPPPIASTSRSPSDSPSQQGFDPAPTSLHTTPYYAPPSHQLYGSTPFLPPPQTQYSMPPAYNPYSNPQVYRPIQTGYSTAPPISANQPYEPPHFSHPTHTSGPSDTIAEFLRQQQQNYASPHHVQPAPLPLAQPIPSAPIPQPVMSELARQQPEHERSERTDDPASMQEYPDPASGSGPSTNAFRPGTATNDTLAPGLSGTGSFSADEVLASEVLRDLMKSPMSAQVRPNLMRGSSGGQSGRTSPSLLLGQGRSILHGNGSGTDGRVPGDKFGGSQSLVQAGDPANEWGITGGFDGFGSTGANTPIEESPAAVALAEYFNKGGVGGISALDLGFPVEPTLFPEWLLNPQTTPFDDGPEQRFRIREDFFNLAYLYPWHVPPVKTLSKYAKRAAETLLPSIPVFHAPSVNMSEIAAHSAFVLTVAGSAYELEGQAFSNEMLVEKRVYIIRGFVDPQKTWEDRFASLQSLLLYQLLGLFHRDEQQRLLSHQFHAYLIYMMKQLDLPSKIKETPLDFPPEGADPQVVEKAWKDWVKVETWRRVAFITFLTDLEHSVATKSPQCLSLNDMDLDLPASEFAWSADSATEWHNRHFTCRMQPPISFLAAIRALMAADAPAFSPESMLIADLSSLSSFPLLILSRMMSYLERKAEEALQQVDPFQPILGGLGMANSREQESRNMLFRIRKGRDVLRRMPGGMARGGGEKWFQDVMPTATGGVPRPDSTAPSSSSTTHSRFSFSSSGQASSSSTRSSESPYTPPQHQDSLQAMFAEVEEEEAYGRDPNAYKPYHGDGGARPGETYEQAQERLRVLRESKLDALHNLVPIDESNSCPL